jgi:putative restriction endonuclease
MPENEKESRRNWTREELILAFNLYCKIPFGTMHNRNPKIIELANLIRRTSSAVGWKLVNFASLDPALQARGIKGASHGSKADEQIWNEFHQNWENLAFESEQLRAKLTGKSLEKVLQEDEEDITPQILNAYTAKTGEEKERFIKTRVNQNFFRKAVMTNYDSKCAVTGISEPILLIASHIIPWSVDEKNRLNPHNGICLNALHDKAFDKGLITVSKDYKIVISQRIKNQNGGKEIEYYFLRYENQPIQLPSKFFPGEEFLEYHREKVFVG